jgi:GT2 family glycosyltransferase
LGVRLDWRLVGFIPQQERLTPGDKSLRQESLRTVPIFPDGSRPHALLITVNYGCEASTNKLIANLSRLKQFCDLKVIIVDNASVSKSAAAIQREITGLMNVVLIESSANLGYFGAARWALQQYTFQCGSLPDWIIVCNNDVEIEDQDFLVKLIDHDPNGVGVLAPAIQSTRTRLDQNPFLKHRPRKKELLALRIWFSSYYLSFLKTILSGPVRLGRRKISALITCEQRVSQSCSPIYSPHGAFLIFSRKYFELGGQIDDGVLLYAEEFSVAEICRRLDMPVLHDTRLRVEHREHETTGAHFSRSTFKRKKEALQYVIAKYLSDLA